MLLKERKQRVKLVTLYTVFSPTFILKLVKSDCKILRLNLTSLSDFAIQKAGEEAGFPMVLWEHLSPRAWCTPPSHTAKLFWPWKPTLGGQFPESGKGKFHIFQLLGDDSEIITRAQLDVCFSVTVNDIIILSCPYQIFFSLKSSQAGRREVLPEQRLC